MTDQEFNEYLEKYQPEFEGNKEHLKILIEYKMLPIDIENIDLKDYPAGARGHFFAVPVVEEPIEQYGWNKWKKDNQDVYLDLRKIDLSMQKGAYLAFTNFENVDLSNSELNYTLIHCACFNKVILQNANLEGVNLRGTDLKNANLRVTNLKDAELAFADLSGADLSFADLTGANLMKANLKGARLYQANFDKVFIGDIKYDNSTSCRGIRLASCHGSASFKRFAQDQDFIEEFEQQHKIIYWLWKISCNCGRSLILWASWSALLAIVFGFIYFCLGEHSFHLQKLNWSLWTMIYYSIVTFTTLGFGDIYPKTTEASIWIVIEVILGYIMLGGLISIFATKLARRS